MTGPVRPTCRRDRLASAPARWRADPGQRLPASLGLCTPATRSRARGSEPRCAPPGSGGKPDMGHWDRSPPSLRSAGRRLNLRGSGCRRAPFFSRIDRNGPARPHPVKGTVMVASCRRNLPRRLCPPQVEPCPPSPATNEPFPAFLSRPPFSSIARPRCQEAFAMIARRRGPPLHRLRVRQTGVAVAPQGARPAPRGVHSPNRGIAP